MACRAVPGAADAHATSTSKPFLTQSLAALRGPRHPPHDAQLHAGRRRTGVAVVRGGPGAGACPIFSLGRGWGAHRGPQSAYLPNDGTVS